MKFGIWRLEWRLALRRRRLLFLNVGTPLLMILPIAVGGAPAYHASAAYTVLFVLFGTFGSAIPLLREGDNGPLRRIVLRGVEEWSLAAQRVLSATAVDLVELSPALVSILVIGRAPPPLWAFALPCLFLALLAANVVGMWVAAAARSIAEGALFAAVVSLFLLHGSGVFRTPPAESLAAVVEKVLPFAPLHDLLFAAAGGRLDFVPTELLGPFASTFLALLATLFAAAGLLERISNPTP